MTKTELMELVKKNNNANKVFFTNSGHKLTLKEHLFIDSFMVNGDAALAARDAGYQLKNEHDTYNGIGLKILKRDYIYEELMYKLEELDKTAIADAGEILQYFTGVMRGEVKDQFGLDAPLSERTRAAIELAKRTVDIENREKGVADAQIAIKLDWTRED